MNTYMTIAAVIRQAKPTEKWTQNVLQKLSGSKNTLSDIRVTTHEKSKTAHPEGKQAQKENVEEP